MQCIALLMRQLAHTAHMLVHRTKPIRWQECYCYCTTTALTVADLVLLSIGIGKHSALDSVP